MAFIDINGIDIAYDIIGQGDSTVAITPGGRFSKDMAGIRELAEALAISGKRVLIWDRPNCGQSDISFRGETESIQNADTLAGLLAALDFGPTLLFGGSGGARDSLLTAIRHPAQVRKLFLLWISGGAIGCATLPMVYCADSIIAATAFGMAAVADLPGWKEQIERNPGNRDRFLALDPPAFCAKLQQWSWAFFPQPGVPMPGVSLEQLTNLATPTMILRSGSSDMHHSRETSERLHALIPGSRIDDPPWGDREWVERLSGQIDGGIFAGWSRLVPQIVAFDS